MPNPILAFYEAAQITAPADVDTTFPPILRNVTTDLWIKFADMNNKNSVEGAQTVVDEILGRARTIAGVAIPNLLVMKTAPSDGVNLIEQTGQRYRLIDTVRGDLLTKMTPEDCDAQEVKIYRALGALVRPAIVRTYAAPVAAEPAIA